MDKNEEKAIASLLEAYRASKPVIDEIADEHGFVSSILGMFVYVSKRAPDSEEAFQNFSRVSSHFDKMFGVLTVLHGTARAINAIMSEHQDSTEQDKKQGA